MSMRRCLCVAAVLAAARSAASSAGGPRPNVALIVADDLGFADQGFMTNASVSLTPHLDALASKGIRLLNHHVQPVCSPTRATLLTGRHVLRYGLQNSVIWPQDAYAVPRNETFLSQNLKAVGYRTAAFGKWHLGFYQDWALPMARGFDEQYGYYLGGEDYFTHMRGGGMDWHRNDSRAEPGDKGAYSSVLLGAAAAEFVTRHRAADTPWFLYLAFQSVHSPLQVPERFLQRYPHLRGSQRQRAAMVAAMDDAVGELVTTLESTGQLESTVIVFTADNGAPFGEAIWEGDDKVEALQSSRVTASRPPPGSGEPPHGSGGGSNYPLTGWKHWVFEGGVRSTAFVYHSRLPGGTAHWGLFHSTDWLPTLARLAGAPTDANLPLDGFDIWDALIAGGRASPRSEIPVNIAACGGRVAGGSIIQGPQAAVIVGDLKLIVDCFWRETRHLETVQLYNLTADIREQHNLAAERPQDVKHLVDRLAHWEAQSVEPYPEALMDRTCGEGKPHGNPPAWSPWCTVPSVVAQEAVLI